MRGRNFGIALAALAIVAAAAGAAVPQPARSGDPADALSGTVTSAGTPMEGVVVTVRQSGSPVATSVVSDAQGRYRFPRGRLAHLHRRHPAQVEMRDDLARAVHRHISDVRHVRVDVAVSACLHM